MQIYTNSTNTTLLIILTVELSILIILGIIILAYALNLMVKLKKVVDKVEEVVNSVEDAAEKFNRDRGRSSIVRILDTIIGLSSADKKKRKHD